MVSFSAIMSAVALTSTYSVAQAQNDIQALPWDGRAKDLTLEKITDKYLTHIFTMRNDTSLNVTDYVTIDQKGRPEGFNCDEGVINIGVDGRAIFKAQSNFRRSELVQFVATNKKGKTFFRTSFKKEEAFLNNHAWQMIFDELHYFEIRVDATLSPPMLIYLNNGTWDPKWETEFKPGTWYNFGIALSAAPSGGHEIEFYTSEGEKELNLTATHAYKKELPTDFEFHIGLLTLSDDGGPVEMKKEQDIVTYNGVSVTADVSTDAGIAGSPICK